ncbi:uncharacterized protein F4807DRAFT_456762 [Annulohypoxylon truncatum]|uniref:uncharacterized protein n=1 Tax=Annulohypoxylon truncatum TaxID=327061 RepID=UPI00200793C8|nr:uncharacterized protein F4807DRAFT_456762 [Annulohypoxylon truncatum]KAI1213418.1 hypothetical protein F4807DRAFT_456762 [Annulohypoxylon truncatum]
MADAVKATPPTGAKIEHEGGEKGVTATPTITAPSQRTTTKPIPNEEKGAKTSGPDISGDARNLVANVPGLEVRDIKDDPELAVFGIIRPWEWNWLAKWTLYLSLYGADNGDAGDSSDSTSTSDFTSDPTHPKIPAMRSQLHLQVHLQNESSFLAVN